MGLGCGTSAASPARLQPDVVTEGRIAGDARHEYRIVVAPGADEQLVSLAVSGDEPCVDVTIFDAAGQVIGGSDGGLRELGPGGATYRTTILALARGGGDLRVRVEADEPIARPAHYRLGLAALAPPSSDRRAEAAAQLDYFLGRGAMEGRHAAELRTAITRFERAAAAWQRLGLRREQALALVLRGATEITLGEPQAGLVSYQAALPLFEAVGDRREAMRMGLRLGVVQSKLGQLDLAVASFRAARTVAAEIGDRDAEGFAWMDLGDVAARRDDYAEAIDALEHARARFEGIDQNGLHQAHLTLGRLYRRLGDVDRALVHFDTALHLPRQPNARLGEAQVLHEIGVTELDLVGDRVGGEGLLARALAIRREAGALETVAESLVTIASARTAAGAPAAALAAANEAVALATQLASPALLASALVARGDAQLAASDASAALASFERARGAAAPLAARTQEAQALVGSAQARRALGDAAGARDAALAALATLETVRAGVPDPELRASYFATVHRAWELEIDLLAAAGDASGSLVASERARARSLLEQVEGDDRGATIGSAAEVQALLDDGTVFVEYALGDARSFAWVVGAGTITLHELAPRARIEAAARRLLAAIGARDDAEAERAASALGELLLGPFAAELGTRRLVVAADGIVEYVPFAALVAPGASEPIVVAHELVLVPSASVLAALRHERGTRPAPELEAVVLADPVFAADDPRLAAPAVASEETSAAELATRSAGDLRAAHLARLRFSRAEAEALERLVPPARRVVALDFAASRATALGADVARARIVHFATHGVVNGRTPALSGLVFSLFDAAGAPVEGFLRASDLRPRSLRAELVVLSGCQTALGRQITGEGLFGLTRAFFAAGTPRVLASLWRVQDKATAELMARFYAALYQRHLSPAAALRVAMLELRADSRFAAAYFWAAFELHGDWR
jgi:CHAT domain-containing protein/tetratricopeptide (TPR) repeat protein